MEEYIREKTHMDDGCPLHHMLIALLLLLFVDDVLLLASLKGLQGWHDALASFCDSREFVVKLSKTKVMIFNIPKSTLSYF